MRLTDYQSAYLAYELTRLAAPDSLDRLTSAVASAQVDLNPHQVDAALFAFKSPLSKGALLADEVGLGKTIEAGLVLSQHWAERKRRLLVIVPANLRKQWYQELTEKFFLPCEILEKRTYNQAIRDCHLQPFHHESAIVICSYQFARGKAAEVAATPWDLVVIDEAHRLRNVYQPSRVVANTIKHALQGRRKLLLTATPLQNSLLELYGLVSLIDDHAFGDVQSFREQFMGTNQQRSYAMLKSRLQPLCTRTLRRQVRGYVSYTNRLPLVEEFTPQESEDTLYELVSEYLRRPNLQALPSGQRGLMTLVLRKLLASSTFAIAGALETMSARLKRSLEGAPADLEEALAEDYEALDETRDEWPDDPTELALTPAERAAIQTEIAELDAFTALATSIERNAKGDALLKALRVAMAKAVELGAEEKAIIFTESRRTQEYLQRILADSPWREGIVLFNGSNSDPKSREIYARWLQRHQGSDRVTGSRTADLRSALVDYFREEGQIMIATEAAAEGINLQFCSLVVNYDLPWNPQRIEQRIGRCHRYGQKHDVVVVNFLNRANEADQRVFQLLSEKFRLFEGVFGASDEVLGAIESGVDFEKRINDIYQTCRRPEEIEQAFLQLRLELDAEINEQMAKTRQQLLEHFDDEVREKLRVQQEASRAALDRHERMLMTLTRHELAAEAAFADESSFVLVRPPDGHDIPTGRYELPRRSDDAHVYRLTHPLAEVVISRAKRQTLPPALIQFDLSGHEGKISALEPFVGQGGLLAVSLLSLAALDLTEEHLIVAAVSDEGAILDDDTARRLLTLQARVIREMPVLPSETVIAATEQRRSAIGERAATRNLAFFSAESDKLDSWADDLKSGLEREIRDLDRQIRETRKSAKLALTLDEKLAAQRAIKTLEAQRNQKRKSLFDAHDQVDAQREALIAAIEEKLAQRETITPLFMIRWTLN
ncbi:MAG: SNF2-related protein [Thermomicrobiales bacterium]